MEPFRPNPPTASPPLSRAVLLSRIGHGLVSAFFLACIAVIYLGVWRGKADALTVVALVALGVEGVLVLLSSGHCPLGPFFRRLGDDTPFFQLALGQRGGKLAFPVLTVVTAIGVLALAWRTLL